MKSPWHPAEVEQPPRPKIARCCGCLARRRPGRAPWPRSAPANSSDPMALYAWTETSRSGNTEETYHPLRGGGPKKWVRFFVPNPFSFRFFFGLKCVMTLRFQSDPSNTSKCLGVLHNEISGARKLQA